WFPIMAITRDDGDLFLIRANQRSSAEGFPIPRFPNLPLCSSVSSVVKGFGFQFSAMFGNFGISGNFSNAACKYNNLLIHSMQPETIHELYLYNHWANQRSLASVAPLSPEQFTRNMGNSFSSVRDTLAHILSAEWIWLERWLGRSPKSMLPASDFPTVEALRQRWATVEQDLSRFLPTLTPERLRQS